MKSYIAGFVFCALILQLTLASKITREERAKMQRSCFKLLRTSPEARERIERLQFNEDDPEAHCFTRCGGILSGFFDDETGTNMEMALAQGDGKPGFDAYKSDLEQCVAGITPEQYGEDFCKKGFLYFKCSRDALLEHILTRDQWLGMATGSTGSES